MKTHKWADIKLGLRPATRAGIEADARKLANEPHFAQLRKANALTQEAMSEQSCRKDRVGVSLNSNSGRTA
jgi:hypothetical protein